MNLQSVDYYKVSTSLVVYYCGFGCRYFQEAIISALSVRLVGGFEGDIILFCDQVYDLSWLKDYEIDSPQVVVIPLGYKDPKDAAIFRLQALNYLQYNYDTIFLYLDTDIVCLRSLDWMAIFSKCNFNLVNLYGYPERTQNCSGMAGFITDEPNILSQKAFCSGLLLFKPTKKILSSFREIQKLYNKQPVINDCWEQPSLCYVLIKNQLTNITLDNFVNELRNSNSDKDIAFFNHLCGLRSTSRPKKMLDLLVELLFNMYFNDLSKFL